MSELEAARALIIGQQLLILKLEASKKEFKKQLELVRIQANSSCTTCNDRGMTFCSKCSSALCSACWQQMRFCEWCEKHLCSKCSEGGQDEPEKFAYCCGPDWVCAECMKKPCPVCAQS